MGRTVWDDVAEVSNDESATNVRRAGGGPVPSGPKRGPALLPWLLAGLAGVTAATLAVQKVEDKRETRAQLAAARDEAAVMRRNLFVTEDKLQAAETKHDSAAKTAAALKSNVDENAKLIADLKAKLDSKDGDVSSDKDRISVNLVDQILFKSGDANLSPRGKEVLGKVGGVLKELKDKQILIGGHTDDRPIHTEQFPSNWELSAARAVNVVHYLAETAGVDAHKLTAAAYSEFHPRAKDKAKNRRIEILLTPQVAIAK